VYQQQDFLKDCATDDDANNALNRAKNKSLFYISAIRIFDFLLLKPSHNQLKTLASFTLTTSRDETSLSTINADQK